MRLAICIGSAYDQNQSLAPLPGAELDLEIISQRFAQADAGFTVHAFSALRGLPEGIEQLIFDLGQPLESLVVYFSGYALLSEERGPALLLDGERLGTCSFKRLRKIIDTSAPEALVILDLVLPANSEHIPHELVSAAEAAFSGGTSRATLIVAARPRAADEPAAPSAFTHLARMILDWYDPAYGLTARSWFEAMQAERALFEEITVASLAIGPSDPWLIFPTAAESLGRRSGVGDAAGAFDGSVAPFAVPTFENFVAAGDALIKSDEWSAALDQYEGARALLPADPGAEHARLYAKIASALAHVERFADARAYYDAALGIEPNAIAVLDGVSELCLETGDTAQARSWLARWLALEENSVKANERLLGIELGAGEHELAISRRRRLAHALTDRTRAAEQLLAAGLSLEQVLNDATRALECYEEALTVDPTSLDVIERLEELLTARGDFTRLAQVYEFALQHARDPEVAQALATQLSELCRETLIDAPRAVRALASAADLVQDNPSLHAEVAGLFTAQGDFAHAAEQARRAVASEPRPEYLRIALQSLEKLGELDSAWNAANALDWLGEADINESLLATQHRPEGLLAARTNLTDSDWAEGHLSGETDPELMALVWAARDAIIETAVAAAKKKDRPELDAAALQDLAKSTTTLAKTLLWTSRLLGVRTPELYIVPSAPGHLSARIERVPTSIASRAVGSGLGLAELAFLWGRHLVQFRPEHELTFLFPEPEEQAALLTAALSVGGSARYAPRSLDADAKRFAAGLKKHLRGPNLEQLKQVVVRQPDTAPGERMRAYRRRASRAALRAGLLACGDIAVAMRLAERFPIPSEFAKGEERADLVAFSIGQSYALLRQKLGVAVSG